MTKSFSHIISTPTSRLENLKNRFLSAVYHDRPRIGPLLTDILEIAQTKPIEETDEKYLRQIITAHKRFISTPAQSYKTLLSLLRDRTRQTCPAYLGYESWDKRLNLADWQKKQVFGNAITFQITSGCSNYCRRCNEWALPKIRGHFTRNALEKFIALLLAQDNDDLALYGGSDPLDWADPPHDLSHVLENLNTPCRFSILTKIPRGKQNLALKLIEKNIPLSVSLTDRNKKRIKALEKAVGQTLSKQHATSDLLIPACLDEDFSTVKPSITDSYGTEISLDGAFIIIPAFTSALYPFGHKKIPVTRDTAFFPVKKLGRPALLVDYFKPLEVAGPRGRFHLQALLDVQVENILLDNGDYDLTPPGMRSVKEYFEIFDDKARQQRKQMTLSVIRRLKKRFLANISYRGLTEALKKKYRDKIHTHLDFTQKAKVTSARITTVSFFLTAIRAYLDSHPIKSDIIWFLTRPEYEECQKHPCPDGHVPLQICLLDPNQDAWKIFRYHALSLVHGANPKPVDDFISNWPASYHPEKDLFIPGSPGQPVCDE